MIVREFLHTDPVGASTAFAIEGEADFVSAMIADIPPPPPGAAHTRALNAGRG